MAAYLDLLETDYFGLVYSTRHEQVNWLVPHTAIKKQIKGTGQAGQALTGRCVCCYTH